MSDRPDSIEPPAGAVDARSTIARTLASSLQLPDVFASVAAAARPILPFERMGISLVEEKALAAARNNKSHAAKLLGLPRGQLYSLLRRHGLTEARR